MLDLGAAQQVAWNVDEDRALLARHRRAEGVPEELRNAVRGVDGERLLGHRAEERNVVGLLEGIPVDDVPGRRARNGDDRRVARVRRVDAGDEVRRAGAVGHEAYGGLTRCPREAVGHEGRALLVPDAHELDVLGVVQGVKDLQERPADDAEDVGDALGPQCLNHRLAR